MWQILLHFWNDGSLWIFSLTQSNQHISIITLNPNGSSTIVFVNAETNITDALALVISGDRDDQGKMYRMKAKIIRQVSVSR